MNHEYEEVLSGDTDRSFNADFAEPARWTVRSATGNRGVHWHMPTGLSHIVERRLSSNGYSTVTSVFHNHERPVVSHRRSTCGPSAFVLSGNGLQIPTPPLSDS